MPLNLIKIYPDLLEIAQFNVHQRTVSLRGVFKKDIEDNIGLNFRTKIIRPLKKEEGVSALDTLFDHLTKRDDKDNKGNKLGTRSFEVARSIRLHWIRFHIEEKKAQKFEVFSYLDRIDGRSIIRTYLHDIEREYVVIIEPQRSGLDYYLITAYHLNEPGGKKQIEKKSKKRLSELY